MRPITCEHPTAASESIERLAKSCNPLCYRRPLWSLSVARMTEYNFVAQYQQDPQPPSGIIVKREWLKFYGPNDKPEKFDQIIQCLGYCKQGYRAFQF